MRGLAKSLKVGVITVQRAYEDLQKEGILETSHGKGSFISGINIGELKNERYIELEQQVKAIVRFCEANGIPTVELVRIIETIRKD